MTTNGEPLARCAEAGCRFKAAYGDRCVSHAARAGDAGAKAELAARGRAGGNRTARAAVAAKRTTCSLRSTDDLLSELERALVRVEGSAADAVQKATTVAKLVSEARATLKVNELEVENGELRRVLAERAPELAARLKAVK